jgi:hypothetical protein
MGVYTCQQETTDYKKIFFESCLIQNNMLAVNCTDVSIKINPNYFFLVDRL